MLPIIGQTANQTIVCHCSTSSAYIAIFKRTLISGANKLGDTGPQPLKVLLTFLCRQILKKTSTDPLERC